MDEFEVFDVKPFVSRLLGHCLLLSWNFEFFCCTYDLAMNVLNNFNNNGFYYRHGRLVWIYGQDS